jgi:hypothetical protein
MITKEKIDEMKVDAITLVKNFIAGHGKNEEKELIKGILRAQKEFGSKGFFVAQCVNFDSSLFGVKKMIGWGERNTVKNIYDFENSNYYSFNGLPSGIAEITGWAEFSEQDMEILEKQIKEGK